MKLFNSWEVIILWNSRFLTTVVIATFNSVSSIHRNSPVKYRNPRKIQTTDKSHVSCESLYPWTIKSKGPKNFKLFPKKKKKKEGKNTKHKKREKKERRKKIHNVQLGKLSQSWYYQPTDTHIRDHRKERNSTRNHAARQRNDLVPQTARICYKWNWLAGHAADFLFVTFRLLCINISI